MKFYIQVDKAGRITDCITFPYKDYIAVDLDTPLPEAFIGGGYEYKDGLVIAREEFIESEE